eukprot:CAMPEP_0172729462 /NCGR_PEP_ID=MMETSP1074-20121228/94901_1 /TAXON_ID=2916 /ORGANISM="Ceratium fusus, Strain PA161109" /LENGTH=197 /DNA_ID=CAMNT_0013556943 /DNA_START=643 /DNA_END=1236 /DNA_ORIENTATION=+
MTNVRTRHRLHRTSAHPGPEADFHFLPTVDPHLGIVASQVHEPAPVSSKESTRHHWRWSGPGAASSEVCGGGPLPKLPGEANHAKAEGTQTEGLRIDGINLWNHQPGAVVCYACQQRLKPTSCCFNVAVEENKDVPTGPPSSFHSCHHQAAALVQPDKQHLGNRSTIIIQFLLQSQPLLFAEAAFGRHTGIVYENDL